MNQEAFWAAVESFDADTLLRMPRTALSERFGTEFADMKDYPQNNPHHCYDLLEHTLRTAAALDMTGLSAQDARELLIAALYHDVGKPAVAQPKAGRTVFYGHAKVSERVARRRLGQIGLGGECLERICFSIREHDAFISHKLPEELGETADPNLRPITAETILQTAAAWSAMRAAAALPRREKRLRRFCGCVWPTPRRSAGSLCATAPLSTRASEKSRGLRPSGVCSQGNKRNTRAVSIRAMGGQPWSIRDRRNRPARSPSLAKRTKKAFSSAPFRAEKAGCSSTNGT